ncbi:[FeFe] hydrogenase, group A [uncultured Subdoligranulum sp.]|uniref:[FeFe] hydrogenase, group A n=1 Tax=uncultured Subdoligranulum sp. TaxID=512298 RepID=UPI00261D1E05|nr:[FeFe] hydrogenase, group A [uncultured Subdoligranulum sp.]
MVNVTVNGVAVQVPEGTTILNASKVAGVDIPHLCYLKDLNEIGACRVCCVEIEGERNLVPSCNNPVFEGMAIRTNTDRVRRTRRINVELILSQHDCHCATCLRSGNCHLQNVANDLGILENPYPADLVTGARAQWPRDFPLYRDTNKCIKCMRCIQVCDKVQGVHVWDLSGTGSRTRVDVSGNRRIKESDCTLCGQCITHCPTGALRERNDTQRAFDAIADPDKITVVQIAPAVRTAWGENLGLTPEQATVHRMAAALRRLGFDYVFDTSFSADLTIMEEGTEFLHRYQASETRELPMFTSCCPGWVRYLKSHYPQWTDRLSTAKSPQQMFGAVTKNYFAQKLGVSPDKIYCVSVMPCIAKKQECDLPTMHTEAGRDVDLVLTTRELVRMIRAEHLHPETLPEEAFDSPLGTYTGAGVIFGATGGVMEAALRSAYYLVNGKNPKADAFTAVRGEAFAQGWTEAEFDLGGGAIVRTAVVSGLGNTRRLLDAIAAGKVHYDFVEVMACPGGCAGGGGQPQNLDDEERAGVRGQRLYALDQCSTLRFSHENPEVGVLYRDALGEPGSERAEAWLHTDHSGWKMPQSPQ